MGVTTLEIEVANPSKPAVTRRRQFTVDSGANFQRVKLRALELHGVLELANLLVFSRKFRFAFLAIACEAFRFQRNPAV